MLTSQATLSTDGLASPPGERRHPAAPHGGRSGPRDAERGHSEARPEPDQDVAELLQEIEHLRRRLATQPIIEQAKGVLVGFYGIHPDAAFAVLVRWSQHTNTKLHLLAERLVTAAGASLGQPQAGLQDFLKQMAHTGLTPASTGEWAS